MEEKLTPEIIIEALRNSYAKEKGDTTIEAVWQYVSFLENKIVDYRLPTSPVKVVSEGIQKLLTNEPVNFLLSNSLRYLDNEQMKVLTENLAERCGLKFVETVKVDEGKAEDAAIFALNEAASFMVFVNQQLEVPTHLMETYGNLYMNTTAHIDEALAGYTASQNQSSNK